MRTGNIKLEVFPNDEPAAHIQDVEAAVNPMDHTQHLSQADASASISAHQRRARSVSQPVPSAPVAGPSNRAVDPFDFTFFNNQFSAGPSSVAAMPPQGYDEAAFARALLALQSSPLPIPTPVQQVAPSTPTHPDTQGQNIPNATQAFLAALPWLQFLQMQNQYSQFQQAPQFQYMPPPPIQAPPAFSFGTGQYNNMFGSSESETVKASSSSSSSPPPPPGDNTPSPEAAEPLEGDQVAIAEDKRRRNTAASARFRIKKKQWTLNLERTISDLSGRVQELEGEAAELRRENGWLKEIVMLKSKRLNGAVPDLGDPGSSSGAQSAINNGQSSGSAGFTMEESGKEKPSS